MDIALAVTQHPNHPGIERAVEAKMIRYRNSAREDSLPLAGVYSLLAGRMSLAEPRI